MGLFEKRTIVFERRGLKIGEFNRGVEGFYENVMPFQIDIKKNRMLHIEFESTLPTDVYISDGTKPLSQKNRILNEKWDVRATDVKAINLFIGVMRGDKATVDVTVWMGPK